MEISKRFWRKVTKAAPHECWLFSGADDGYGYGSFHLNGKTERSHRMAWTLTNGPIPEEKCVLHRCDVRRCCNPAHLFLGSRTDNSDDRRAKGRAAKKLTPDAVREIRAATGRQKDIGARFGVSQLTVWQIKHRVIWKHIE